MSINIVVRGASLAAERSVSVSEGGWSEVQPNREGVASGSATQIVNLFNATQLILPSAKHPHAWTATSSAFVFHDFNHLVVMSSIAFTL